MEIGIVGLGRMGANMARRLARGGARVVAYDREQAARDALAGEANVECVEGLAALAARLAGERVILVMLPAGAPTEDTLRRAAAAAVGGRHAGGRRQRVLQGLAWRARSSCRSAGLRYIDAGVSGGVHGLANGYCLMLGGTPKSIEIFEPFARILAPAPDTRLAALRAERRRPLRQDGPQRHRVRDDAGAGPRASRCSRRARSSNSTSAGSPRPGATAAWCARWLLDLCAEILAQGRGPAGRRAGGGRLRRRPLDRARIGGARRARAGDHHGADGALLQPGQIRLREEAARDDARQVRRACGTQAAHDRGGDGRLRARQDHHRRTAARARLGCRFLDARRVPSRRQNVAKMAAGTPLHRRGPLAVAGKPEREAAARERTRCSPAPR